MRITLLLLALPACIPAETGIDRTVLSGTITIPPAQLEEARGNDALASAQALGPDDSTALTYRATVVTGTVSGWVPAGIGDTYGDPDYYAFSPLADGTFTFNLNFLTAAAPPPDTDTDTDTALDTGDTASSGPVITIDTDVLVVEVVDLATYDADTGAGVIFTATTDGSGGAWTMDAELVGGADYAILVAGVTTDEAAALPYTLVLGGAAPDDTTLLVGAYLAADPLVAENPLGGTNATGWVYDPATYTWTAGWRMMWLREVIPAGPDEDTGDLFLPSPSVNEASGAVNLRAAMLSTLSASPSAGSLYTTLSVATAVTGTDTVVADILVVDGVVPKVVGVQATETLPDTTLAEINAADNSLILDTLVAQDLGMLSGLGFVDIISGSNTFDPAYAGWNLGNDSDAYAFTVPETLHVRLTAGWADPAADIDVGIWFADASAGVIDLFDWACLTGANPEVCDSAVTLEPEVTYYLVSLAYAGTDEQAYTIELEWLSP